MKRTRMGRRGRIRVYSYLLAAAAVCGAMAWISSRQAVQWRRAAENQYAHAFDELVTAVGELDAALEKSLYATSPSMVNAVCTEVFGKAMTAQMSLGVLPFGPEETEKTSDFISRVGDFAFSLSRSAALGQGYSSEQRESLRALSETADVLHMNLEGLQTEMQAGRLTLSGQEKATQTLTCAAEEAVPQLGESVRLIEQEFPEVPSLIYDGPFSEHLVGASPKALEGLEAVDEETAREIAARFLTVSRAKVYPTGARDGDLPCWGFAADTTGGGTVYALVTKQGGKVVSVLSSRPVGTASVDVETAIQAAGQMLRSVGYTDMAETYHMTQGGIVTVNYAYRQGDTICYSDLVKVSVALDTGRVVGFEAAGYLNAHCTRTLAEPAVSAEQARAVVQEDLEVLAVQRALVPSEGKYETLCYEFKCAAADGRHYIIYADAMTGLQHKILILLEDESGTLTL